MSKTKPSTNPVAVDMGMALLYWRVGQHIGTEMLAGQRATYGEGIVVTLSRQLVTDCPAVLPEREVFGQKKFRMPWCRRVRGWRSPIDF